MSKADFASSPDASATGTFTPLQCKRNIRSSDDLPTPPRRES
jgi:hypothetical protein